MEGPDLGCGNHDTDIVGANYLYQPLGVLKGENWSEMWVKGSHPSGPFFMLQVHFLRCFPQNMETPVKKKKLIFPKGGKMGFALRVLKLLAKFCSLPSAD